MMDSTTSDAFSNSPTESFPFFFGDAKIDLSMFELCVYNVAMGNDGPEIKEAADYVTDDVDNDGLYKAFDKLSLL